MPLRALVFWCHLTVALLAGTVIFVMCVTGALLAFEKQLVAWTERDCRSGPADGRAALPLPVLESRAAAQVPGFAATSFTIENRPDSPLVLSAGRRTLFIDRYTGTVLGEARQDGVRAVIARLRAWHRWLGAEGTWRPLGRFLTGWSNVLFAVVIATGLYLWVPATWTWARVRQAAWFKRGARGKARDFNWHHVVGLWSALPLLAVILGGLPISFPWAGNLLYRIAGDTPPAPRAAADSPGGAAANRGRGAGVPDEAPRPTARMLVATETGLTQARVRFPEWRAISVRWPGPERGHVDVTVDLGTAGQPQHRVSLEVDPATGEIEATRTFASQSPGRRLRSLARFAHTGEVFGLPGQAIAGLASAGGALLVWTGFALTWRRFAAWRSRRRVVLPNPSSGLAPLS